MFRALGRAADAVKNIGASAALRPIRRIASAANQLGELIMPDIQEFSQKSQQFLQQHGQKIISSIKACRTPLSGVLQGLLTGLGGFSLAKAKEEANVDKYFHTFMRIGTTDGTQFTYEKDERPHFTLPPRGVEKHEESMDVPITGAVSLADMCENAIKAVGKLKYFKYDPFHANCQEFLIDNIRSSYPGVPQDVFDWIDQNAAEIAEHIPEVAASLSKDLVGIYNRISTK